MPGHFVCTYGAHANTTSILSSSFSHSVELPLGFTGVVLYLHHLCETVTFTDQFRYSKMTFQIICEKAVPAHCIDFLIFVLLFVFFLFFCHLLLSKAAFVYDCVNNSNTCLSPVTKGMGNYFLKSFQYLKITLLLHGSLHIYSHSTANFSDSPHNL